jgi:hypothetical protein
MKLGRETYIYKSNDIVNQNKRFRKYISDIKLKMSYKISPYYALTFEVFWNGLNGYYFEKKMVTKNIHSRMMVNVIIQQKSSCCSIL